MRIVDLIREFRSDHRIVIDKLFELEAAFKKHRLEDAKRIVDELDLLAGPHMKFEEEYLYPTLRRSLGDIRVDELLHEHGDAAAVIKNLRKILNKPEFTREDSKTAVEKLSGFLIHVSNCEGLNLLIEKVLSVEERRKLAIKLFEARLEGKPLTEWKRI